MKKQTKRPRRKIIAPKNCAFCDDKKEPTYLEADTLRKYLTERGKIMPGSRTGICSKHQKRLSNAIKRARFLALLPSTPHHL